MDCLTGRDGLRRFAPAGRLEPFLLRASLGGLAVLAKTRGLDAEGRFGYDAMRLIFQHAPLLREHLGRSFKRESDLYIPGVERAGRDGNDILPERIGLGRQGRGRRWGVAELLRRGRTHAVAAGDPSPDVARCIAAGLLAAARRDPLDPARVSEAEARGLVRMALFDAGPSPRIDPAAKQAVTERLLAALGRHAGADTGDFNRWFFGGRDDLVHGIAKQKKHGGRFERGVVRQALLELVWDAYTYVGDCVCMQMQAFLQALPAPLGGDERALFEALYLKQPHLGGLPLVLLRDRFDFLREAILDALGAPGEPGPVGVLLRLMQYYEEMAAARRDVDRGYKNRAHHRDAKGRVARTLPLVDDPSGPHAEAPDDLFQEIAARLREGREVRCACAAAGPRRARLPRDGADDGVVVIVDECERCDRHERIEVPRPEFERIGWEVIGSRRLRARGGLRPEPDS
jgi:hypothetical protein